MVNHLQRHSAFRNAPVDHLGGEQAMESVIHQERNTRFDIGCGSGRGSCYHSRVDHGSHYDALRDNDMGKVDVTFFIVILVGYVHLH